MTKPRAIIYNNEKYLPVFVIQVFTPVVDGWNKYDFQPSLQLVFDTLLEAEVAKEHFRSHCLLPRNNTNMRYARFFIRPAYTVTSIKPYKYEKLKSPPPPPHLVYLDECPELANIVANGPDAAPPEIQTLESVPNLRPLNLNSSK